jgi:hypothetical protein
LEFDLALDGRSRPADVVAAPRVFFDFARARQQGTADADARLPLAAASLAPFLGCVATARLEGSLGRCFAALPCGADLPYLGLLPASRESEAVRVCVRGLRDTALPTYLLAVGWPGAAEQLARVLEPIARAKGDAPPRATVVHLDVGARVRPPIAVEYVLARRPQIRGELPGTALFDYLVARGLCDRRKRDGLQTWPGCSIETLGHELWPSVLMRRANHIKVGYRAGRACEVKAYLSISHEFRRPQPVSTE